MSGYMRSVLQMHAVHSRGFILPVRRACTTRLTTRNCTTHSTLSEKKDPRSHVLALDFDGVICASAGESSQTAVVAASKLWPSTMQLSTEQTKSAQHTTQLHLCNMLKGVRPLIETGYENVLLARYLYEHTDPHTNDDGDKLVQQVLDRWNTTFRDTLLKQYGAEKTTLMQAFAAARDEQIQLDLPSWVRKNHIYPHVSRLLRNTVAVDAHRTFIVTTKQERFVRAILQGNQIDLANTGEDLISNTDAHSSSVSLHQRSNIFDLHNVFGAKANVLKHLTELFPDPQTQFHFVEDRVDTLLTIAKLRETLPEYSALHRVHLYLADWGYNTLQQRRKLLQTESDIKIINPDQFQQIVRLVSIS